MGFAVKENTLRLLACIGLCILVFLCYRNMLDNSFYGDDFGNLIIAAKHNLFFPYLFNFIWGPTEYRPVRFLFYEAGYALFGLNAAGYCLLSFIIHAVNSLLVFLLAQKFIRSLAVSCFVAALFSVFRMHTEAVYWIAASDDLLATFFLLLCFCMFIRFLGSRKKYSYVLSLFFYGLALFTKESTIALMPVLFFYELFVYTKLPVRLWAQHLLAKKKEFFLRYLPFFAVLFLNLFLHICVLRLNATTQDIVIPSLGLHIVRHILDYIDGFWFFIFSPSLVNFWVLIQKGYPQSPLLIFGVFCAVVILFLLLDARFRFSLFWFCAVIFPSAAIKDHLLLASRYFYLASIPYILSIGILIDTLIRLPLLRLRVSKIVLMFFCSSLIAMHAFSTFNQEEVYDIKGQITKKLISQIAGQLRDLTVNTTVSLLNIPRAIFSYDEIRDAIKLYFGKKEFNLIFSESNDKPLEVHSSVSVYVFVYDKSIESDIHLNRIPDTKTLYSYLAIF